MAKTMITSNWQQITDQLLDNYLTLVDLNIRIQKDFEYSFAGYSNQKLADMLEHRAKFDFKIDEVIAKIRRLAKTHKYSVVYDNINLFIYFAESHGRTVGSLYMIEPHMTADDLGLLYEQRKDQEEKLLEHIEDFKDFINIVWDPNNGITFRMRINEKFKMIREEAGLSQVQVAQMVEATQGTISNLEKSIMANPTFDIIKGYITKVGANPAFLFGLDPEATPIIHPTIQAERLRGSKDDKVKSELIKELEQTIEKLKSL
ncbi:helix-turn-helix domain-containing protein [Sphingobacterium multivorum]|uniref:helix-turn-helix domain-containing protein n=1 Tax=Sphingobacterium multivorum TaxID=28454 RepID=UPI0028A7DA78|nr:helix-turn-helix domain-containing protein [Sphingobacterium multivorum]